MTGTAEQPGKRMAISGLSERWRTLARDARDALKAQLLTSSRATYSQGVNAGREHALKECAEELEHAAELYDQEHPGWQRWGAPEPPPGVDLIAIRLNGHAGTYRVMKRGKNGIWVSASGAGLGMFPGGRNVEWAALPDARDVCDQALLRNREQRRQRRVGEDGP